MAAKGDHSVPFGASQSFLALRGAWTSHPPPVLDTAASITFSIHFLLLFLAPSCDVSSHARHHRCLCTTAHDILYLPSGKLSMFVRGARSLSFHFVDATFPQVLCRLYQVRLSFFAARMTLSSNSDLIIVAEFIEVRDPVAVITSLTRISSASFSSPFGALPLEKFLGKELGNYHLDCGPIPSSSCKGHAVWFWTSGSTKTIAWWGRRRRWRREHAHGGRAFVLNTDVSDWDGYLMY
ncbi:hypothetical protein B0H13DRAFT_2364222 [Mycena leptocephala]|nr:hypothetical protein B0H13DRAFT_2364222 [Mycena leptocephala]